MLEKEMAGSLNILRLVIIRINLVLFQTNSDIHACKVAHRSAISIDVTVVALVIIVGNTQHIASTVYVNNIRILIFR